MIKGTHPDTRQGVRGAAAFNGVRANYPVRAESADPDLLAYLFETRADSCFLLDRRTPPPL